MSSNLKLFILKMTLPLSLPRARGENTPKMMSVSLKLAFEGRATKRTSLSLKLHILSVTLPLGILRACGKEHTCLRLKSFDFEGEFALGLARNREGKHSQNEDSF